MWFVNCAQKAQAVYDRLEDTKNVLVIGADTVVSAENRILGKPHDRDDAFRMLKLIQGESHSVFTGVTLIHNDGIAYHCTFTYRNTTSNNRIVYLTIDF